MTNNFELGLSRAAAPVLLPKCAVVAWPNGNYRVAAAIDSTAIASTFRELALADTAVIEKTMTDHAMTAAGYPPRGAIR